MSATMLGADGFIGQVISHYRLLDNLGGGGMGVVYEAEDLSGWALQSRSGITQLVV